MERELVSIGAAQEIAKMRDNEKIESSYYLAQLIDNDKQEVLQQVIENLSNKERQEEILTNLASQKSYQEARNALNNRIRSIEQRRKKRLISTYAASVAAVVVFGFILYFSLNDGVETVQPINNVVAENHSVPTIKSGGAVYQLDSIDRVQVESLLSGSQASKSSANQVKADNEIVEVIIPPTHTYDLTLPCGTVVKLNSNSKLKYYKSQLGPRRVELSGEAYFKVVKSDNIFEVAANGSVVKVYGTEFNVNSSAEGVTQTLLVKGDVGITVGSEERRIVPGELSVSDSANQSIEITAVDIDSYIGWISNKFVYTNRLLSEVIVDLSNWYGIKIDSKIDITKLNVSFYARRSQSVDELFSLIERVTNVTFINNGGGEYEIIEQ